ncbi:MAG: hypothetical protein WC856_10470 [Methylococcaceae bacterium]
MNFNELSFDGLDQHAMERLVFDQDEMSPILKGHIFIEKVLETLIANNLTNPDAFFRSRRTFELKLDLAYAMALFDEKHYSAFKAINRIRNSYAHTHDYKVSIKDLSSLKFDWVDIQKKAYEVSCTKGAGEAARISIIFLSWKAIALLKKAEKA